jgi:hypothetical protein
MLRTHAYAIAASAIVVVAVVLSVRYLSLVLYLLSSFEFSTVKKEASSQRASDRVARPPLIYPQLACRHRVQYRYMDKQQQATSRKYDDRRGIEGRDAGPSRHK